MQAVIESFPYIISGMGVTLGLVGLALALGLVVGIPMAVGQAYGGKWTGKFIAFYVWIFRGLPNLVLLFLFYFGIFPLMGLNVSAFFIGALALGLRSAAYQTEIFRGAILSLGEGQMLAARSLGMSKNQAILNIILPQALRIALPGWSNEYPILLTDSSVCYAIGVMEIMTGKSNGYSDLSTNADLFYLRPNIYFNELWWIKCFSCSRKTGSCPVLEVVISHDRFKICPCR